MKLIHLSDLHIGKRVNEISMLPDQNYILAQILSIVDEEKPDAVLIAGDVYDKTVPPAEAVTLFDDFLCHLAELGIKHTAHDIEHRRVDCKIRIVGGGKLIRKLETLCSRYEAQQLSRQVTIINRPKTQNETIY